MLNKTFFSFNEKPKRNIRTIAMIHLNPKSIKYIIYELIGNLIKYCKKNNIRVGSKIGINKCLI